MTESSSQMFRRDGERIVFTRKREESKTPVFKGRAPFVSLAEQRALWSVPFLLSDQSAPLFRCLDTNRGRLAGAVVAVCKNDTTSVGRIDGQFGLVRPEEDDPEPKFSGPGAIDIDTLPSTDHTEFVPVEREALVSEVLAWTQRSVTELDDAELRSGTLARSRIETLLKDGRAMFQHYQKTGSLEGFEIERTLEELEALVFDVESESFGTYRTGSPRTLAYVRHHNVLDEVLDEVLDNPERDSRELLRVATTPDDELSTLVFRSLAQRPVESAVPAARMALRGNYLGKRRAAVRVLAALAPKPVARKQLEKYVDDDDSEVSRIATLALRDSEETN